VVYRRAHSRSHPAPRTDEACLESFERELDYLFVTLRRLGAAPHEVEDLVQDVFLVLYRNWKTLDTSRPLRPYLFGVAFRLFRAHQRRRRREVPYAALDPQDEMPGPEGSFQSKESTRLVLAALARLPLSRRAALVMHELDEVPVAEVARALSLTRFGTYARLRKARKELEAAIRRLSREERLDETRSPSVRS
jgi:RNA polymerase sigma-70 factor (ECF subfamily)